MMFFSYVGGNGAALLKHSKMSPGERETLDRINRAHSEEISEEFAVLNYQTQLYLSNTNCNVSYLLACVMDVRVVKRVRKVMHLDQRLNQLMLATSVGRVFVELVAMNLISYLQFSIVERIVKVLCKGSEQLQRILEQYKENFKRYVMRRVCDSAVYQDGKFEALTAEKGKNATDVVVITDDQWDECTEFLYVLELKDIIAHALNITNFNMELLKITPQCLKLHLAIPVEIAMSVFPLTLEEWNKLSSLGIVEISCLSFTYKIGKYSTVGSHISEHIGAESFEMVIYIAEVAQISKEWLQLCKN